MAFIKAEPVAKLYHQIYRSIIDLEKLSEGGDKNAQQCSWLKDKFGVSWQIVPSIMTEIFKDKNIERVDKVMAAGASQPMSPTITAFKQSPDRGRGLARDMRVRWALEEVGQPYNVRLVTFAEMKEPAHHTLHPFGQIPTYEEGDLVLFESGAIVLHIAQHHAGLLPNDANARARAITWMFAALNTVEPPLVNRQIAILLEGDKPWAEERLPLVDDRIRKRLHELSNRLGEADWLDGAFSAGDLMMVHVLLMSRTSGLLDEYPNLSAYVARAEARPAYKRAFAAQLAVFTGKPLL
jgi:glutathione S-transferase